MTAAQVGGPHERAARPPVLQATAVNKNYGAVRALQDVSLAVSAGEIVSIVGENGAGKSTLVRIVSGLEHQDSGELQIDGNPIGPGRLERQRAGIRIAPQELLLCPDLTVAENIFLGDLPVSGRLLDTKRLRRAAEERLARLGMTAIPVDARVEGLPVVAQAFVQIARAMTDGARILVLDEPTAPMSGQEVDALLEVVRGIAAQGTAVLYISHRLDEVFALSDRVVVLRDGRNVAEFVRDRYTHRDLVLAMVGSRESELTSARSGEVNTEAPLLTVRGISGRTVRPLDLDVRPGELLAVYGVLGSGRDELGGLITGAVKATAGRVSVGSTTLRTGDIRSAIAAGVGFVPAERRSQGLALELSIRQNLTLGVLPTLRGRTKLLDRTRERALAQRWVDLLDISTPSIDTEVGRLSGGGQQKVLIARWLAAGSRVLVLEEPTRGVDIATKAAIYQLLRDQAAAGCAVLILSSDLEEVAALHTRVLVLVRGRISFEGRSATQADIASAALHTAESDDLDH